MEAEEEAEGRGSMEASGEGARQAREFRDATHASEAFALLDADRLRSGLTDVEIEVEERSFPAHKAVLAATIPYFASMFGGEGWVEARQSRVPIRDISAEAFAALLHFAYTATLSISDENVQGLLYAASILQMDSVCGACEDFLTEHLSLGNCLSIRAFAQLHNCSALLSSVDKFSAQNFRELRGLPEFLQMGLGHLLDLLRSDDLDVESELSVYEAVMDWVRERTDERKEKLPKLLTAVRLSQLPKAFLFQKVKNDPLVAESSECRGLILEAMEEHYRRDQWEVPPVLPTPLLPPPTPSTASFQAPPPQNATIYSFSSAPPKPFAAPTAAASSAGARDELPKLSTASGGKSSRPGQSSRPRKSAAGVVFCVGGRGTTGDPFRTVEAYDWGQDTWFPVTEMGVKRRHVGVVSAEGRLYAIGGHDGSEHLGSAEVLEAGSGGGWRAVASMGTKRRGIAVGCLEGAIYAVGGLDDSTCFQIVERYDIEADRWSGVAEMNVQRGGVGVAALGKFLFAVGGNDGTSSLDSCERYDPHLDKWILVGGMAHRRAGAGVCVLNGALYAIGGFDDNSPLSSCERYDPRTGQWSLLPGMSCPRGGVGVAAMGGRLYAVGGHDGVKYLDSVEALDPEAGLWEAVASISHCRAGAGVSHCPASPHSLRRSPQPQPNPLPSCV